MFSCLPIVCLQQLQYMRIKGGTEGSCGTTFSHGDPGTFKYVFPYRCGMRSTFLLLYAVQ